MLYFGTSGFSCVDQPRLSNLLPPLAEVTSKTSYVRFHGRKSAKWQPETQKLDGIAERSFIFTDNHWRGQAVGTIRQLRMILD